MATWRIEMRGPPRLFRDGEPLPLRTRHQGLLVARLAAHGAKGVDRSETADLLWPEAERSLQAAYLRRAIMELRRVGLPVEGEGSRLWIAPSALESPPEPALLDGVEHPIAYEVRGMARGAQATAHKEAAIERTDTERLLAWIGDTLVTDHPDVALEMLARHGADLMANVAAPPVLSLFLRTLSASSRASLSRTRVTMMAAHEALYLTKYGLAERLLRCAIEECDDLGDGAQGALALSMLAFLQMECRRGAEALEIGRLAVERAQASGDLGAICAAHNNLAGIEWHSLRFEEALENYALAETAAPSYDRRLRVWGNVALVAGVYGWPLPPSIERPGETFSKGASLLLAEAHLYIGYGLAHGEPELLVAGVAHLLRVSARDGLERYYCLGLDYAAYGFGRAGRATEAAACVRIGSRARLAIGHRRSPAEGLGVRLHVPQPYFGREIAAMAASLAPAEPTLCAERIVARLEATLTKALGPAPKPRTTEPPRA